MKFVLETSDNNIEKDVSPDVEPWPCRTPDELCGVWVRNYIKKPASGTKDASVEVRYLQTPVAFVDVRVVKNPNAWPVQPKSCEEIQRALAERKAEGFAGVTTRSDDGVIRWHACINLEPQIPRGAWAASRRGTPPTTEDCGKSVPSDRSDTWLEYGYPDASSYMEEWQRAVEESKTNNSWLAAINIVQNEILIVCDDFFGYARDQRQDGVIDNLAGFLFKDAATLSICSGRVSTGWIVDLSAVGFWESRRLVVGSKMNEWQILPGSTLTLPELVLKAGGIYPDILWHRATEKLHFLPPPNHKSEGTIYGAPFEHSLTDRLYLRKLRAIDLVPDYQAVMEDVTALRSVFTRADTWPSENLTQDEDYEDLRRHDSEFDYNLAFAYAVYDTFSEKEKLEPGKYIGCCYINPPTKQCCDAEVFLWIRPKASNFAALDAELERALRIWLVSDPWPYRNPAFPGRDPRDEHHLTFDQKWTHWESRPWLNLPYPRICVDASTIVLHQPRASGLIP
mmetsp:Transcript_21858/g.33639  ORF Transcript_21858/g.33639 Transcript_21858/m.33639 type:complete len:509 (-) Transcript_21858:1692-3218(-)|eukprot:CAMPEP_0197319456 /NCGR_PEP_ID=MMETSP0891-20130614/54930_1 /TAXON_ID=44058 ORGANISM="Aureoumbra lagunensis, Strain CCMP1510" /NCGR_SAMPLE_ID=MMETSP0891 /ASSEMBLY_ACC=CAM_ASM_000534 /LENGTH=508 /DNA_ID=CAMNT_0042810391 /DNA_START=125 /DNA_END=1651 /DNA_ORIENTATION=+